MRNRRLLTTFIVAAWVFATAPRALSSAELGIVILSPTETDVRLELAYEAIAFWNRTFEDLGLGPAFGEPRIVAGSVKMRALENYAWQISRRAGRPAAGSFEPDPPQELLDIEADIVVLLSVQGLMPFSWPLRGSSRTFIAIHQPGSSSTTSDPRNVIAHELGHAVGLEHNDDPSSLMCLPCGTSTRDADAEALLPLTPGDRARLVELYSQSE